MVQARIYELQAKQSPANSFNGKKTDFRARRQREYVESPSLTEILHLTLHQA